MANIQQRGKNSWYVTVYAGKKPDGTYKRETTTIQAKNKTEAKLLAAQFEIEVKSGAYIAPEKMILSAFVGEWRKKYAEKHLAKTTLQMYMEHLNGRILPLFGHKRLDSFKTFELVSYFESKEASERADGSGDAISGSTLQLIYRALRNVFSRAKDWKIIKENPMDGVKKPKEDAREMQAYDKSEVGFLLAALEREPTSWRIMVTLAVTCGLRQGELLGLEWKHIDTETGVISVQQALTYTKDNGYDVKDPKTKASKRTMALPGPLIPLLKDYRKECNKKRLKAEDLWEEGERYFVFTGWNGKPLNPSSVKTWWKRFLLRHPSLKRIRFHDLRHTSATFMLMQGTPMKAISKRLGHSRSSVTEQVYIHILQEIDQAAADTFNSLFTGDKKTDGVG
jgi:integrase